jgi:ribosome recycling factor
MQTIKPFSWMKQEYKNSFYNETLGTVGPKMTEEDAYEYAKIIGKKDISKDINTIKNLRETTKELLKDSSDESSIEDYVKKAYPYEVIFI